MIHFSLFLLGKKNRKMSISKPQSQCECGKKKTTKHMEITIKTTYFLPPLQNSFQLGP